MSVCGSEFFVRQRSGDAAAAGQKFLEGYNLIYRNGAGHMLSAGANSISFRIASLSDTRIMSQTM